MDNCVVCRNKSNEVIHLNRKHGFDYVSFCTLHYNLLKKHLSEGVKTK